MVLMKAWGSSDTVDVVEFNWRHNLGKHAEFSQSMATQEQFEIKYMGKYCRMGICSPHLEKLCKEAVVLHDLAGLFHESVDCALALMASPEGFLQELQEALQKEWVTSALYLCMNKGIFFTKKKTTNQNKIPDVKSSHLSHISSWDRYIHSFSTLFSLHFVSRLSISFLEGFSSDILASLITTLWMIEVLSTSIWKYILGYLLSGCFNCLRQLETFFYWSVSLVYSGYQCCFLLLFEAAISGFVFF